MSSSHLAVAVGFWFFSVYLITFWRRLWRLWRLVVRQVSFSFGWL
jgi:hypothetical protein